MANKLGIRRNWIGRNVLAFVLAAVYMLLYGSGVFEPLEMAALDWRFRFRPSQSPPPEVVVISLDDNSYEELGLSFLEPIPRRYFTALIERLKLLEVKRAAFDFVFRDFADNETDRNLTNAFSSFPTVVGQDRYVRSRLNLAGEIEQYNEFLVPHQNFTSAVSEVASIRLYLDGQVVRRFTPFYTIGKGDGRSLAAAAIDLALPADQLPGERDFINFYGPPPSVPSIPLHEVLQLPVEELRPMLKDKYVVVGLHRGIRAGDHPKDSFLTPFGDLAYGVEVHAVAAGNLLTKRWIHRGSVDQELALVSVGAFLGSIFLFISSPAIGFVMLGLFWMIWLFVGQYSFEHGFFLPGASLVFGFFGFVFLVNALHQYLVESKSRKEVESAFSRYISPTMLKEVKKQRGVLSLGGTRVEATALFTDLAGFTAFAENRDPEDVATILNVYFSDIATLALEEKGTLIRFTGDGMYVLFGAPIQFEDHKERAVITGLKILEKAHQLIESGKIPPIATRVGIHSGLLLAGNLGSKDHMNYTAIGDVVNTASRLEGACKHLGVSALCSEEVAALSTHTDRLLPLGMLVVAGRQEAISIFGLFREVPPDMFRSSWNAFLLAIMDENRTLAAERFAMLGEWEPLSKVMNLYRSILDSQDSEQPQMHINLNNLK